MLFFLLCIDILLHFQNAVESNKVFLNGNDMDVIM